MPVWFVTGKLGAGKTLVAVSRIQEYLQQGRPVATNLDLDLNAVLKPTNKTSRVIRLPDKPSSFDMDMLGRAYSGKYNEDKFGLIVLDELGTWLNSRTWSDKSRKALIDWLIHARKLYWDIIMIVQNIEMVDVQLRNALCEYLVVCRRTDRVKVMGIKPPKVHVGKVYYGSSENPKLLEDRWFYRGTDLYKAYDTTQVFSDDYESGTHSLVPPGYFQQPAKIENRYDRGDLMKLLLILCVIGVGISWYMGMGDSNDTSISVPVAVAAELSPIIVMSSAEKMGEMYYTGMALFAGDQVHYFESKKYGEFTNNDISDYGGKVGKGLGCSQNIEWNDGSTTIAVCNRSEEGKRKLGGLFQ